MDMPEKKKFDAIEMESLMPWPKLSPFEQIFEQRKENSDSRTLQGHVLLYFLPDAHNTLRSRLDVEAIFAAPIMSLLSRTCFVPSSPCGTHEMPRLCRH